MTEKFVADFNKPHVGAEFAYVGQPGLLYEAFLTKAVEAMRRAEIVNGVTFGELKIEKRKDNGVFIASAKVKKVDRPPVPNVRTIGHA